MAVNFAAECSSCGSWHRFYLAAYDFIFPGLPYYFTCPETGDSATAIGPDEWHEIQRERPQDSVEVRVRP